MFERLQFRSTADQQVCLQDESTFLTDYLQSQSAEAATVEYLQQVARVRLDLDMAASLIIDRLRESGVSFWWNAVLVSLMMSTYPELKYDVCDWYISPKVFI